MSATKILEYIRNIHWQSCLICVLDSWHNLYQQNDIMPCSVKLFLANFLVLFVWRLVWCCFFFFSIRQWFPHLFMWSCLSLCGAKQTEGLILFWRTSTPPKCKICKYVNDAPVSTVHMLCELFIILNIYFYIVKLFKFFFLFFFYKQSNLLLTCTHPSDIVCGANMSWQQSQYVSYTALAHARPRQLIYDLTRLPLLVSVLVVRYVS